MRNNCEYSLSLELIACVLFESLDDVDLDLPNLEIVLNTNLMTGTQSLPNLVQRKRKKSASKI